MAVAKRENLFHFNYLYLFLKHFFLNGPGLSPPPLTVCVFLASSIALFYLYKVERRVYEKLKAVQGVSWKLSNSLKLQ